MMQPGRANVPAVMIAHGAEHSPLQLSKGHVVGEPANVQFGVLLEQKFHSWEQKFHSRVTFVNRCFRSLETQGGVMTTLQAMCLGAMLAWTPSLVVLALLLRAAPVDDLEGDPS